MKILVISGFLGAGKTTFIKELARQTQKDFAVMENEYGAIGIDGSLLAEHSTEEPELNIWELTEGCICCTMKSDFASSILTIANTIDPEYLIVEPTGVGMLSKIIENIQKIEYERISLLAPITILDGSCFEHSLQQFPDVCLDQLQAAKTIVISKREGAKEEELTAIQNTLRSINETASLCLSHYSKQEKSWWEKLLHTPLNHEAESLPSSSPLPALELENLGLTSIHLEHENQLILFLQGVVSGVFGRICRAKGYLPIGKTWLRFDVVDQTYSITGIEPMEESRAVFIGNPLKRSWLRQVLQKELYQNAGKPTRSIHVTLKSSTQE